ncbi:MAG: hypothetical protein EOO75_11455 [Myxococcales bacterium]|nr:MAG: hypothetical protein EOO75_11455 [Myxococcales bacterium]
MTSGRLLSRLLLVATPALAACTSRDAAPSAGAGGSPRGTAGGPAGVAGGAPTAAGGHGRTVQLAAPPLRPVGAVPTVSALPVASARPGQRPLTVCGPEFHSWPDDRSGGPIAQARCYAPAAPLTGCLGATAPELRPLLGGQISCIYDGPHAQTDPASSSPWCCYNVGFMGMGRPLIIDRPRLSSRVARPEWA